MSYAAAFRPVQSSTSYGYAEVTDPAHPSSPWQQLDQAWGADPPPRWGARRTVGEVLAEQLGGAASGIGRQILADPYVQAELDELKEDCRTKAKAGVSEWVQENKWLLIAGGAGLIFGNFLMLTLGVLPAVERATKFRG